MKAEAYTISHILREDKYIIPPYQRPYLWDKEKAEELIGDIYSSHQAGEEEYFIGSIICNKGEGDRLEVVDGQQRLITLSLILLQFANTIKNEDAKAELSALVLKKDGLKGTIDPVLQVRKLEEKFYVESLLRSDNSYDVKNLTNSEKIFLNNYNVIGQFIKNTEKFANEQEIVNLATFLRDKVSAVLLKVDNRVSSFRLFNVLNNRGMPLSDADLIKSELLHTVAQDNYAFDFVKNTWQEIEEKIGEENLNEFLTLNQISQKLDRNRANKRNYNYYQKQLIDKYNGDSAVMCKDLLHAAENYVSILEGEIGAKNTIFTLSLLSQNAEWLPALLAFCNNQNTDKSKFSEFTQIFEKAYMHHFFQHLSKSQRDSACYFAIEAINNNANFDVLMHKIQNLTNNEQFEIALDNQFFYDEGRPMIINFVKTVLLRVEQERHDDSAEVKYDLKKLTVEHILPQDMNDDYWKKRFSDEQHKEWLNRLGNLTLLPRGKNSAAKNYDYDRKKEAYEKSNQKSRFEITKDLCVKEDYNEWNMDALRTRHEELKDEIKKIWLVRD